MRARAGLAMAVAVAVAVAGCGSGSGSSQVSANSLKPRLLASIPGLQVQRPFDWKDPVDLVGEGLQLPQATHPSQAVAELRKNGYEGGAGIAFTPPNQAEDVTLEAVAKLGSATEAAAVRDWVQSENLIPPCFTQCTFSPRGLPIPGVPGAKGVAQVQAGPPPGTPGPPPGARIAQPTNYFAEFTIGQYMYYARTQGLTQDKLPQRFLTGVKMLYAHASTFK